MNSTLDEISTQKQLIKSLLKREDALEARPDVQREMLAEYVRNFDVLEEAVRRIIKALQTNQNNTLYAIQQVLRTVKDLHLVINETTFKGLEDLVTEHTNFSLQKFVQTVQAKAIKANFEALNDSVTAYTQSFEKSYREQNKHINELQEQVATQQKELNSFKDFCKLCLLVMTGFMSLVFLAGIGFLVSGFATHPIATSIITAIIGGIGGFLAYLAIKYIKIKGNGNDDDEN